MLARLHSVAMVGIEAVPCEVEVDVYHRGFKGPTIVGLPDMAVKESIHRIKSALNNCGYPFPRSTSVINLAPADLKKEGPSFDLPLALGLVFADAQVQSLHHDSYLIMGELALDGRVRSVKGAISAAMLARRQGLRGVIVPAENAKEAAVVEGAEVIPVATLTEAVGFLTGELPLQPTYVDVNELLAEQSRYDVDFDEVRGQENAKRALTVAAAGAHNILMIGPSASSKLTPVKTRGYDWIGRGGTAKWSLRLARPPWVDGHAPLEAGQPEQHRYQAPHMDDDMPVSDWSDTFEVPAHP